MTPRRSHRLRDERARTRDVTPEVQLPEKVRGPRSMSKLKKAKQQSAHNEVIPEIKIQRASLENKEEEELTVKTSSFTQTDVSVYKSH